MGLFGRWLPTVACSYWKKLSLKPYLRAESVGWSSAGSSAACSVGARGPELGRPSAAAEAPGIVVHGEGRLFDQHIFLIGSGHPGVSALPRSRLLLHLS